MQQGFEGFNPVYVAGLGASNRMTDARGAVHELHQIISDDQKPEVMRIYNALCGIQGQLEALLKDVPAVIRVRDDSTDE